MAKKKEEKVEAAAKEEVVDVFQEKIDEVNRRLEAGEPNNIRKLNFKTASYLQYKPWEVIQVMDDVFGNCNWDVMTEQELSIINVQVSLVQDTKVRTKVYTLPASAYEFKHQYVFLNALALFGIGRKAFFGMLEEPVEPVGDLPEQFKSLSDKLKDVSPNTFEGFELAFAKEYPKDLTADHYRELISKLENLLKEVSPDTVKMEVIGLFNKLSSEDKKKIKAAVNKQFNKELSDLTVEELKRVKDKLEKFVK